MKEQVTGAITYPQGFLACGVRAGLKNHGNDIALIYSEVPAGAVGLFTQNIIKAAPVVLSSSRLPSSTARAIIANSGNANACTGEQGMRDAERICRETAHALGIAEWDVLIASTGVIGVPLPMDRVSTGIEEAAKSLSKDGAESAVRAIMTTDTYPKQASEEFDIGDVKVRIGGIAKGAGMIDPNVATLLAFITTDADITPELLRNELRRATRISFNCLTIDGDTSTNDTVIALANGMAGNRVIRGPGLALKAFRAALNKVTTSLAMQLASDGEGATKMLEITVSGAETYADCHRIAKTIANSPLVKTAMFGCDPNWGRILAAAGRAGVDFDPNSVTLKLGDIELLKDGEPIPFSEKDASDYLKKCRVDVQLKVGAGDHTAVVWTCDLSHDYIHINAEYRT